MTIAQQIARREARMTSRVNAAIKIGRKGAIPKGGRVRRNTVGYGFSFKVADETDGNLAMLSLDLSLPSYCKSEMSKGRVYVSVYPW